MVEWQETTVKTIVNIETIDQPARCKLRSCRTTVTYLQVHIYNFIRATVTDIRVLSLWVRYLGKTGDFVKTWLSDCHVACWVLLTSDTKIQSVKELNVTCEAPTRSVFKYRLWHWRQTVSHLQLEMNLLHQTVRSDCMYQQPDLKLLQLALCWPVEV